MARRCSLEHETHRSNTNKYRIRTPCSLRFVSLSGIPQNPSFHYHLVLGGVFDWHALPVGFAGHAIIQFVHQPAIITQLPVAILVHIRGFRSTFTDEQDSFLGYISGILGYNLTM